MFSAILLIFLIIQLNSISLFYGFILVWFSFLFMFLQVLFFTTCERKILALSQRRVGPTVVGDRGRLQYFADAIKILVKQYTSPRKIHSLLFSGSAIATFWFSWFNFCNLTFSYGEDIADIDFNIFFGICCTIGFSLAMIMSGWASGSKYALMGCIRAVVQSISYEIIMSSVFLCLFSITGSSNFEVFIDQETNFSVFIFFPVLGILCFLATLAETNRPPFDLSEAESDVVAGYSVEYAGVLFGLFYLGEYINIFTNAFIMTILFIGCGFDLFTQLISIIWSLFSYIFIYIDFIYDYFDNTKNLNVKYLRVTLLDNSLIDFLKNEQLWYLECLSEKTVIFHYLFISIKYTCMTFYDYDFYFTLSLIYLYVVYYVYKNFFKK